MPEIELPEPRAWIVKAQYPYVTMDPPIEGGLPRDALYTAEQVRELVRVAKEQERVSTAWLAKGALEAIEAGPSASIVMNLEGLKDQLRTAIAGKGGPSFPVRTGELICRRCGLREDACRAQADFRDPEPFF